MVREKKEEISRKEIGWTKKEPQNQILLLAQKITLIGELKENSKK